MTYTEIGLHSVKQESVNKMKNRTNQRYAESFKLEVLQEYYESGSSINSIARKYGLGSRNVLLYWLKQYPIGSKEVSLSEEEKTQYMVDAESVKDEEVRSLKQRVSELEKALEYAKLRARGMEVLIDVAEKNEGINIRKKTGARQ